MASSDRDLCALCLDKGISEEAVTWCTECEVFLCTNCEKHHILRQVKSSAFDQLLEKDLKDVKENFEEIIKYVNCRIDTINVQKTKVVEKVRSMRKSLDVYLNKLEQEILYDLETKHSNIISQMNILLQQRMQRNTKIGKFQNEFSKMTQYATELEMYVGLREMEKTTSQAAKYIEDLESGDNFDESDLR
ncbi:unnamed protein product [Mytilus edulis]|uniref:B box-type domain-containing protein n=1 Tax=Mytilus edulis TaxID=6550 RepID=A0A8S3QV71_MYTED|nr:unnamed protein product [Mytilus edulis]